MNRDTPKSRVSPGAAGSSSASSSTRILLVLAAFGAAALFFWFHGKNRTPELAPPMVSQPSAAESVEDPAPSPAPPPKSFERAGPGVVARRQAATTVETTVTASPASLLPDAIPAQQLIARISQSALGQGNLSPDQANQIKQNLHNLVLQGAAGVPAIREYLEKNQDLNFGAAGASMVGYGSLRAGLFDALSQIGGPEAQGLLAQTLRSTADPSEIAQLARILEQQAPGQFRQDALNAARETLDQMANSHSTADPGPLFQLLKNYGDTGTASDLAARSAQWPYYSMMSLANLSDGQGISILVQQVQSSDPAAAEARTLALRMLAQLSPQNTAAASALEDLARSNQISDRNWRQIAAGLSGDQYQFETDSPAAAATPGTPGFKTYHIEKGNQNFYSLPVGADSQVAQRISLIDQLLATVSNPAAVQQLQQARATLAALTAAR